MDLSGALSIGGAVPFVALVVGMIKYFLPNAWLTDRVSVGLVLIVSAVWTAVLWQSDLLEIANLATAIVLVLTVATSASGIRSWSQGGVLGSKVANLTGAEKEG